RPVHARRPVRDLGAAAVRLAARRLPRAAGYAGRRVPGRARLAGRPPRHAAAAARGDRAGGGRPRSSTRDLSVPARAVSAVATVRASMRALLALLLAAAALGAAAPATLADADPPSDVLLLQSVYYPYQPPVSDK